MCRAVRLANPKSITIAVPPHAGGFTVWPGSHAPLYHAHTDEWHWSPTDDNQSVFDALVETIQPAEIVGRAGDVCFMHGRTIHSAGQHYSPGVLRMAMFADFQQQRPSYPEDTMHPSSHKLQWWHDSRQYREPSPVHKDMWASWLI